MTQVHVAACRRCGGPLLGSHQVQSCLSCGWEPGMALTKAAPRGPAPEPRRRNRYRSRDVRDEALAIAAKAGPEEASRQTGVPKGTISSWVTRSGGNGHGASETVTLVAGTVTLSVAVNLLTLAGEERAWLLSLIDQFREHPAGEAR